MSNALGSAMETMLGSEERNRIIGMADRVYAANIADAAERVKIQAAIADRALQSLMLANGGAMVALFSFVGSEHAIRFDAVGLKLAFVIFAIGIGMTLAAHVLAFVSQDRFYLASMLEVKRAKAIIADGTPNPDQTEALRAQMQGQISYIIGLLVAAAATGCFIGGCWFALRAVM